ncbi:YcjF family protein [Deinococcus roseus]|uniref:GTPase n=1 Tax=Deinococcus roseus TaxID=392414 RepID=A0ABQ2CTJ1_9DEIO|nr:DUF697 domain-containing protein [Deinococcus roseus]GGJ19165.1 hypothetical protein GCM10008938_01490 [Deinococcus roseus]
MLPIIKQLLENFKFDIEPNKTAAENAEDVIKGAATLSAVIAAEPIPVADILLITPVQIKMVVHVGKIYGFELNRKRAKEIMVELGASFAYGMLARQAMRQVAKVVAPVLGGVITAPLVYGWTFALGKLAEEYFKRKKLGLELTDKERKEIAARTFDAEYSKAEKKTPANPGTPNQDQQ